MRNDKNNSGVAFSNSEKKFQKRDKANPNAPRVPLDEVEARKPDYKGRALVDGKPYWLAMWRKHSDKAGTYYTFALTPKTDDSQEEGG